MDSSHKERGKRGVVCSLSTLPDGRSRIVLNDVVNLAPDDAEKWQHACFVTFKDYETAELHDLVLSDEELAAFGHYVLARLVALNRP